MARNRELPAFLTSVAPLLILYSRIILDNSRDLNLQPAIQIIGYTNKRLSNVAQKTLQKIVPTTRITKNQK